MEMTRAGGGASPDVCPRASDTLATPLEFCAGNCTEWRVSTFGQSQYNFTSALVSEFGLLSIV